MSDFDKEQRRNKENKERQAKERQKSNASVFRSYGIGTSRTSFSSPTPNSPPRSAPSTVKEKEENNAAKVLSFKQRTLPLETSEDSTANKNQDAKSSKDSRSSSSGSLPGNCINHVIVDNYGRLYVVFMDSSYALGSIALSMDNGRNWTTPPKNEWRHITAASLQSDRRLYIQTSEQRGGVSLPLLMSTADGGSSWQSMLMPNCPIGKHEVFGVSARGDIFVGTGHGLFCSRDRGQNWTVLLDDRPLKDPWIFNLTLGKLEASGVQKIYALSKSGLLISIDGGKKWQLSGSSFADTATMVHVDERGVIYLGSMGHGVCISRDGGRSWVIRSLPEDVIDCHVVDVKVRAGTIYASLWDLYDGGCGLAVSKDEGLSWKIYNKSNSGLADDDISSLWIGSSGRVYAGTLNQGLSISSEDLSRWETLSMDNTGSFRVSP